MRIKGLICFFAGLTLIFMAAFCKESIDTSEIKHYPIDDIEGIITRSDVGIDKEITSDGNGSLFISVNKPATVRLYETGDIDIENSQLIYQAMVRTEGVEGRVYIEMLCHFPGKGEFFSRALQSPLSGSQDWTTQETPFFLKKGENPDNVKINLVVEGKGNVWIDDIRLIKGKLLATTGGDMEGNDSGPSFRIPIFNTETGRVDKIERIVKSNSEWKKILTSEQYRIMREKGTEAPFTGKCEIGEPGGIYKCVACGTDLFRVDEKFESGTGWPSFWEPVSGLNIREEHDDSHGMERTEVLCARCDGHLGHVFNDGPAPTYKRYCINAAALKFIPAQKKGLGLEKAVFAAGCFWGVEETFRQTKGVISTKAGYTGGHTKDPTYEDVCTDRTGHAEAVLIEYDPSLISYDELLEIFWKVHDPTTPNRQGPDIGSQYRSVIFYFDESQRRSAMASMEKIQASGKYKDRIVTEIVPVTAFYPAEDYHQKYYMKRRNPSCSQ